MKHTSMDERSPADLLSDAASRISSLMRKEVDLARAEIDENLKRAIAAAGLLVAAIVFALTALHVLAAALVAAIVELGLEPGWASLIVGLGFALLAFVLAMGGLRGLSASSLAPTRTAESIQADVQMIKETTNA